MSRKSFTYAPFNPEDPFPLNMSTTDLGFVEALCKDEAAPKIVYVENCGFRVYDPEQGIWKKATDRRMAGQLFAYAGALSERAKKAAEQKRAQASPDEETSSSLSEQNTKVLNYLAVTTRGESWGRKVTSVLSSYLSHAYPLAESDFDKWPNLVCFKNCTIEINYETGKITRRAHSPEHMLTRRCPYNYNPKAQCPKWEAGLRRTYVHDDGSPDEQTITFMQRYFGHALSGKHDDRRTVFMGGHGCNGKTHLMRTLWTLFGDHQDDNGLAAWTTADKLICRAGPFSDASMYAARLVGARFAFADEVADNRTIDEAAIKRLTGDVLEVTEKYKNPRGIRLRASIIVAVNSLPTIRDTSEGMSSRLACVPHKARFGKTDVVAVRKSSVSHDSVDGYSDMIISEEAEGVIAWVIAGMQAYLTKGNPASPAIVKTTQAEIEDAKEGTPFGWFEECAFAEPGQKSPLLEAYRSFVAYYREQHGGRDSYMMSSRKFKQALVSMGVEVKKTRTEGNEQKVCLLDVRVPPVLSTAGYA